MPPIYADYAASTPTDSRIIECMAEINKVLIGNPSSQHGFGAAAEMYLNESRDKIAHFLNCQGDEVYFTASGTESNNLALLGVARANRQNGNHIITTAIEHPSIINVCRALERDGFEVTYLPVDQNGVVSEKAFRRALTAKTILASIHLANSELGVVQDIKELAKIAHSKDIYFHTDACQAAAFLDLDVEKLGVDLLTINGTKLYGPRGVAALFVRQGVQIFPLIYGGGQEQSLRSGTENVPGIVGLALAGEIATRQRSDDTKKIGSLRNKLQAELEKLGCQFNVKSALRLPNHLSVVIPSDVTDLVGVFDQAGIAVSSGSACSSRSLVESYILQAIGLTSSQINQTIRISLGRDTTLTEIKKIVKATAEIVD